MEYYNSACFKLKALQFEETDLLCTVCHVWNCFGYFGNSDMNLLPAVQVFTK
jgi:hypothetical protein